MVEEKKTTEVAHHTCNIWTKTMNLHLF